jgi:hypothetical protein
MATAKGALATYGAFNAYGGAAFGVIIGASLCTWGAYMIHNPDKTHTEKTTGKATKVACSSSGPERKCDLTAKYTVNNTPYQISGTLGPTVENQDVVVYYSKTNPSDAQLTTPTNGSTGGLLIGCGFLIALVGILWVIFFRSLSNNGKAMFGGAAAIGSFVGR